ncbi:MAG: type IV pilin protein [Bradymonadia bacterium]
MKRTRHHSRKGFTLIELMAVVSILGVLTVLAVNGYQHYVVQARTAEAVNFLGGLRASQESYFQTFGTYCGDPNAWAEHPEGPPGKEMLPWRPISNDAWQHLGVQPPSEVVWYQYQFRAGGPDDAPPNEAFTEEDDGKDWYQIQAKSDFDGNGREGIFEVTSRNPRPFMVADDE